MKLKFITIFFCSLLFFGCGEKKLKPEIGCSMTSERSVCGRSVEGRDIQLVRFGNGEKTILFIASIHGSERAGTPLMEKFIEYLTQKGACRFSPELQIVIMPKSNPDGFEAKTRANSNKVDLNRNFPADNRENNKTNGFFAYSEPESRTIAQVIDIYRPRAIIAFHEALNCIDYDGPAEDYAEMLAGYCDIEVKKLGARPGSLGAYAGEELGIPTITLEFPAAVREMNAEQLWEKYSDLVIAMCEKL